MIVMKVIEQKEYFSICKCFCHLYVFGANYFTCPVTGRELHYVGDVLFKNSSKFM